MDIDDDYTTARLNRTIIQGTLEEFEDARVQAYIEGRRKRYYRIGDPPPLKGPARIKAIVPHVEGPTYPRHYDSQGYCDNPGRGY